MARLNWSHIGRKRCGSRSEIRVGETTQIGRMMILITLMLAPTRPFKRFVDFVRRWVRTAADALEFLGRFEVDGDPLGPGVFAPGGRRV